MKILRCSAAGASKRHISAFGNGFRATREAPANHCIFLLSVAGFFFFSSSIFQSASVRASDWGLGIFDYANGGDWLSGDDQCNKGDSPMMVWKKTAPFS